MLKLENLIKKLLPFCFLGFFYTSHAQQMGQYSQYMLNYYLINPAVAGTEDFIDLKAGYRMQWTGFSDAPRNYYLTGNTALGKINSRRSAGRVISPHHAVGGMVSGQKMGLFSHNTAYVSYAYHIPLTKTGTLSFGAIGGFNQFSFNNGSANFGDGSNEVAISNHVKWDMGLGLWFYTKKMFAGLSSMQLFNSQISYLGPNRDNGYLNRHYYLTAGYKLKLNTEWMFIPSFLVKGTTTAFQLDINSKIKYRHYCWFGASYRRQDAVAVLAGFAIPLTALRPHQRHGNNTMLEVSYSYDITTSRLSNYSYGSHEIVVGVKLPTFGKMIASPSDFW